MQGNASRKRAWISVVLLTVSLFAVIVTYQNCGPTLPAEEEVTTSSSQTASRRTAPSVSGIVGSDPLPIVPYYTTATPAPGSTTSGDTRVCQILYASGVEFAFGGRYVTLNECTSRFNDFTSNHSFDQFQLTCRFGMDTCGSRAPVAQEKLTQCTIRYGTQTEVAFGGAAVTNALCVARYNQFVNEPAFNSMALNCSWDNQSCGSRPAVQSTPQGKCTINYGGNIEQAFGGIDVSQELCVARYNQFVNEPAFNPFSLSCTWNNAGCGQRGPVAQPAPTQSEPVAACLINYGGNLERSYDGQAVTLTLCKARFNQFATNSAFDALSLTCSFGGESCGMRGPTNGPDVAGVCVITFGGNVEKAFDGQSVTKSMCQARFNQFVANSAFNSLQLSCRFNGGDICGERGPM